MTFVVVTTKEGVRLVRQGLQNLSEDIPKIGQNQIWKTLVKARATAKIYPNQVAGSNWARQPSRIYIRTYRLKKSVKIKKIKDTKYGIYGYSLSVDPVEVRKGYDKHYGRYVKGDPFSGWAQVPVHAGRWSILRDDVQNELNQLPKEILDELKPIAKKIFFGHRYTPSGIREGSEGGGFPEDRAPDWKVPHPPKHKQAEDFMIPAKGHVPQTGTTKVKPRERRIPPPPKPVPSANRSKYMELYERMKKQKLDDINKLKGK